MPKIVLTDGRILELTPAQQEKLAIAIMVSSDFTKQVRVDKHTFRLDEIETDRKKITEAGQSKMFDIAPSTPRKKQQMG